MNILITGGAGFIGTHLSTKLLELGHRVCVLDNFIEVVHGTNTQKVEGVEVLRGDVSRASDWDQVFVTMQPEIIFHLAAETGTGSSLTHPTVHTLTNVHGTAQLIEQLQKNKCNPQRIILSSSRAVYGEGVYIIDGSMTYAPPRDIKSLNSGIFDFLNSDGTVAEFIGHDSERISPKPTNIYASTKLAQEHLLQNYSSSFGVSLHIQRFQNVYGQGQALSNPYTGILVQFMNAALTDEKILIYENGGIIRDFVHVDDVVSALILSMNSASETFLGDIGSGHRTTIEEVAEIIVQITNSNSIIEYCDKFRLGDVRKAYAVIKHANNCLNYTPRIELTNGLSQFADWAKLQSRQ